jgi:hypothetical protein
MPRYRITGQLPEVLEYRSARYRLRDYDSVYSVWCWACEKEGGTYGAVVLLRARSKEELEQMRREGFDVPAGGAAEKIMQRLVRDGVAEQLIP